MNALLRKIFESDIKNAHRENEELILKRNDYSMEIGNINARIKANMEYIAMINKMLKDNEISPLTGVN